MNDNIVSFFQILHGQQDDPLWDDIYVILFWVLLLISTLAMYLYYFYFNQKKINWFSVKKWGLVLIITSFLGLIVSFFICYSKFEGQYLPSIITFSIICLLFTAIIYILLSFIFSRWSKHAANTPFKWNKLRGIE